MRICVLTDTLGDVNGVSRFIQNTAELALQTDRDLHVLTSTRFAIPGCPNIHNFKPVLSRRMPRYENLEIVLPPRHAIRARLDELRPDVVHVSTPGPVGHVGRRWALSRRVPLAGIYHTDFPAYAELLFHRAWLGDFCRFALARFYRPFARVITRSATSIPSVERLGIPASRITPLNPGIDTSRFDPSLRELGIWASVGVPELARPGVNILAVSRLSVEMERALTSSTDAGVPRDVFFLGFRHGTELARIYATSDLFVFPSETDTLGQVVMEAHCSGLPAIVSNRGGPSEIVRHMHTGLAIPAGDAAAWSSAIIELAIDADRRRAMGRHAAQLLKPLTLQASFDHYWQIHKGVLAETRTTPPITSPRAQPIA
jgi:glycosyltransferase involved in cell wall biosynthesis